MADTGLPSGLGLGLQGRWTAIMADAVLTPASDSSCGHPTSTNSLGGGTAEFIVLPPAPPKPPPQSLSPPSAETGTKPLPGHKQVCILLLDFGA